MYCQKCGKQLPDGSAFCSYCGTQQGAAAPTQPSYDSSGPQRQTAQATQETPVPQPQQKPKKKWVGVLITLVVIVAARQIGAYVGENFAAPALMSGTKDSSSVSSSTGAALPSSDVRDDIDPNDTENGGTDAKEINKAYQDVFVLEDGRRIFHVGLFLFATDTKCFAMKDEDGSIICRDYGYRDDIVTVLAETWYYPGISADQTDYITLLNESAEEEAAKYREIACASVTYSYEEGGEYFKLEYKFTDLDQPENYQALQDMGMTTGSGAISMSLCEKNDLKVGYIEKYIE